MKAIYVLHFHVCIKPGDKQSNPPKGVSTVLDIYIVKVHFRPRIWSNNYSFIDTCYRIYFNFYYLFEVGLNPIFLASSLVQIIFGQPARYRIFFVFIRIDEKSSRLYFTGKRKENCFFDKT
jgi:hypothetical protein